MTEGNVTKIIKYLESNGVFYVTDLLVSNYSLFLIPYEEFVRRFETIKNELGSYFLERIDSDYSLVLKVYKD